MRFDGAWSQTLVRNIELVGAPLQFGQSGHLCNMFHDAMRVHKNSCDNLDHVEDLHIRILNIRLSPKMLIPYLANVWQTVSCIVLALLVLKHCPFARVCQSGVWTIPSTVVFPIFDVLCVEWCSSTR